MRSQILAEDASFHMKQCLFDQYQNWSVQRPLSLSGSFWPPPRILNRPKSPHWLGLTKWRVSPRTGSKKLIYFSADVHFKVSKNWHMSQPPRPRRGRQPSNYLECAQRLTTFTQFLVKLWRTIFRLRPRWRDLFSLVAKGAGIFEFEISENVNERCA